MDKLQILLNLLETLTDEKLDLSPKGVLGSTFFLDINGNRYGYNVDSGKYKGSIEDLEKEFLSKIDKPGAALAWLKSVTTLASGSLKGISPILRGTPSAPVNVAKAPKKTVDTAKIMSLSGKGSYDVSKYDDGSWGCSCPDHQTRHRDCKHIKIVQDAQSQKVAASATGQ